MMIDDRSFRDVDDRLWDTDVRLAEMDRTGVRVQAISTVPVMFSYWAPAEEAAVLARALNDHIARVVGARPDRLIGLGTVPLQSTELAVAELDRCVLQLGMAGVQIGSHVGELDLDAPELFPVLQRAEQLEAAVFVHPWDMLAPERMRRYWLPWLIGMPTETALAMASVLFGGVLEKLPTLRIGFAHGGGAFAGIFGRLEHGFEVRPDLVATRTQVPPRDLVGRIWVDSLVHDQGMLARLMTLHGSAHVFVGTDYPFPLGDDEPARTVAQAVATSDDPGGTSRALSSEAALAFLGRPAGRNTA
jgi:aminocarboxymuconate-semialdehyde decarboxylase